MNRRETLLSLLMLGAGTPLGARAQAPTRRLGILSSDPPPGVGAVANPPFRDKLKQLGWVEGQNLEIVGAYADRKTERLAELAADLVRQRVDVISAQPAAECLDNAGVRRVGRPAYLRKHGPNLHGIREKRRVCPSHPPRRGRQTCRWSG
jgi:putative ABC transport system substrate-binding protein